MSAPNEALLTPVCTTESCPPHEFTALPQVPEEEAPIAQNVVATGGQKLPMAIDVDLMVGIDPLEGKMVCKFNLNVMPGMPRSWCVVDTKRWKMMATCCGDLGCTLSLLRRSSCANTCCSMCFGMSPIFERFRQVSAFCLCDSEWGVTRSRLATIYGQLFESIHRVTDLCDS